MFNKRSLSQIWASSLIRMAESKHMKAVLAHKVFGVSLRNCAKFCGMDESSVRRAIKSYEKGRDLGVNGRPRTFLKHEEAEIEAFIVEQSEKHESLRPSEILDIVRVFSLL